MTLLTVLDRLYQLAMLSNCLLPLQTILITYNGNDRNTTMFGINSD